MIGKLPQEVLIGLAMLNREFGPAIRLVVGSEWYEGEYRTIAEKVYSFIDRYRTVPGRANLKILFQKELERNTDRDRIICDLIKRCVESVEDVNAEYVYDEARKFVRRQSIKKNVVEAYRLIDAAPKDDSAIEKAERLLQDALRSDDPTFNPGYELFDGLEEIFDDINYDDFFRTGIEPLDAYRNVPARGTLYLFIGASNAGKSWFLTHVGCQAILSRKNVLHVTLEMADRTQTRQRYLQCLFDIALQYKDYICGRIDRNPDGSYRGIGIDCMEPKLAVTDPEFNERLSSFVADIKNDVGRLFVRRFPTGRFTLREFEAYLDSLDRLHGFLPDIVFLDYPDLMSVDHDNYRLSLDDLFKNLRGIAIERNFALVTPTQSNRAGAMNGKVFGTNVAESWAKHAHADIVVTLTKTNDEYLTGHARLFVDKSRGSRKSYTILLAQCYDVGKFAIDAIRLTGKDEEKYIEEVKELAKNV